jgi:hypothetical protein
MAEAIEQTALRSPFTGNQPSAVPGRGYDGGYNCRGGMSLPEPPGVESIVRQALHEPLRYRYLADHLLSPLALKIARKEPYYA